MNEQTRVITGAMLGTLAGSMMVFLVFTDRGRDALRRVGPALDDVSRALEEFRSIVRKVDSAVQEAQAAVTDVRAVLASNEAPGKPRASPQGV